MAKSRPNHVMRLAVLPPLALAAAAQAGADVLPQYPGIVIFPPTVEVRLVTFNVLSGVGSPGSLQANAVGDMITVLDLDPDDGAVGLMPDIVCLQECQQGALGNLLAFRDAFLPGYLFQTASGDGFIYNATLYHPDFELVGFDNINTAGPRNVLRTDLKIPGVERPLVVFNAHFKAFTDPSSQATRELEALQMGVQEVPDAMATTYDLDDNGSQETSDPHVIVAGDLNSNNNIDGTLDNLFDPPEDFIGTDQTIPAVLDLPYETLAGALDPGLLVIPTFQSFSRLDYICLDGELAGLRDTDADGILSQGEINASGFAYWSNDDNGTLANGNSNAIGQASDHRPVVADLLLPTGEVGDSPVDVNANGLIDAEDALLIDASIALGTPADANNDGQSDVADVEFVQAAVRQSEVSDVLTVQ